MRIDFLFVFDNIVRDLPSVALISFLLKKRGYNCEVRHLSELNNLLRNETPKVLVLNKPFLNIYDILFKQVLGMKVCVLHTEGAMGARFLEKTNPKIDLYFFWNEADKLLYQKRNPWDNIDHPVVGCQRTDFLFPHLKSSVGERNPIFNCDSNRLVVSIASPGGYAGLSEKYLKFKQKQLDKLSEAPLNLKATMAVEEQVAALTSQIIEKILNSGLNITVLFKPHPNENIEVWNKKFANLPATADLQIINDLNISDVLSSVDVHICAGHCQTLSEAIMMGVVAIGFNPDTASSLFDEKWMSIGSPHFNEAEQVVSKLKQLILKKQQDDLSSVVEKQYAENSALIDHFFAFRDGKVCLRCADNLETLVETRVHSFAGRFQTRYVFAALISTTRRFIGRAFRRYLRNSDAVFRHKRNNEYADILKALYADYERVTGDPVTYKMGS